MGQHKIAREKPKGDKWKEPLYHLSKARYIAIGGNYLTRSKRRTLKK